MCVPVGTCVCVCVPAREIHRERERVSCVCSRACLSVNKLAMTFGCIFAASRQLGRMRGGPSIPKLIV